MPMIGDQNGKHRYSGTTSRGDPTGERTGADARAEGSTTGESTREETRIRAGEIIATRCWLFFKGTLASMSVPYIWYPGAINQAGTKLQFMDDLFTDHGNFLHFMEFEPETEGFYAFKTMALCESEYDYYNDYTIVRGKVALWGTVFEHELGYRGQYAKIISLENMGQMVSKGYGYLENRPSDPLELVRLQEKYGVGG